MSVPLSGPLYDELVDALDRALTSHLDHENIDPRRGCCADIAAAVAVTVLKDMGSLREDWPEQYHEEG